MTDPNNLSPAPRILISRMSGISDVILTLPVVCCLRDHFPHAYLGWLVEPKSAPMVRGHRALDCVIELDRGWYRSLRGLRSAQAALRDHRFDIAIDCQGNFKSSLAGKLAGASTRIGFRGQHAGELGRFLTNEKVVPVFHHAVDRSLELLTPLGIHHPRVRFDLPVKDPDKQWAQTYRNSIGSSRVAILNPGGNWPSKRWEVDRFASTARYLADRYGYHSLVAWGTFEERLIAEEVVGLSNRNASLAPDTSLETLAALIQTADLFLSGDACQLHMAVAVDTPAIGLYGATRPGDSGPYQQVALQMQYEAGSRRRRRKADNRAMRAIGVEHVCAVIDDLHAAAQPNSHSALRARAA